MRRLRRRDVRPPTRRRRGAYKAPAMSAPRRWRTAPADRVLRVVEMAGPQCGLTKMQGGPVTPSASPLLAQASRSCSSSAFASVSSLRCIRTIARSMSAVRIRSRRPGRCSNATASRRRSRPSESGSDSASWKPSSGRMAISASTSPAARASSTAARCIASVSAVSEATAAWMLTRRIRPCSVVLSATACSVSATARSCGTTPRKAIWAMASA